MSAWWLVPWALLWLTLGVLLGRRVRRWARRDRELFDEYEPPPGGQVEPRRSVAPSPTPGPLPPPEVWMDWLDDWVPPERHDEVLTLTPTGRCTCGRPFGHEGGAS
jgi:hypothetical protein